MLMLVISFTIYFLSYIYVLTYSMLNYSNIFIYIYQELIPFISEDDSEMKESSSADTEQSEVYKQVAAEHLSLTQVS